MPRSPSCLCHRSIRCHKAATRTPPVLRRALSQVPSHYRTLLCVTTHVSFARCGCGVEGQLAPTCKRWRVAARAGVERRTRACAVVVCDGRLFVFGGGGVWSWRRCICVCIVCMCASWSVTCVYVHTLSCAIPGMCRTWGDRLGRKEEEGGPGCLLFHPRRGVGLKLA